MPRCGPLDYRVAREHGVSAPARSCSPRSAPPSSPAWCGKPDRMPSDAEVGDNRLRPLAGVYDLPPIAASLRRLIEWTADYYLVATGRGAAHGARLGLARSTAARTVIEYRAHRPCARAADRPAHPGAGADRRTPGYWCASCAMAANVSDAVIRGLVKAWRDRGGDGQCRRSLPDPRSRAPLAGTLDGADRRPRDALVAAVRAESFQPFPARRGHRVGQDRGLFRSGRRGDPPGPARRSSCCPRSR